MVILKSKKFSDIVKRKLSGKIIYPTASVKYLKCRNFAYQSFI